MNSKKINYILIIIWFFITVFTMFHHELWRDEARVWNFLQQKLSYSFPIIADDGHPFMWYILILPFAKLKLNPFIMQIFSLISVFISVCLVCFKTKLNLLNKILFIFSAGMIYYFPIQARNYALIPLFLFILALFYNRRDEKPYLYVLGLILLSQTHALIWGLCIVSGLIFSFEQFIKYKNLDFKSCTKHCYPILILFFYLLCMLIVYTLNPREAHKVFNPVNMTLFSNIKDIIFAIILAYQDFLTKCLYFLSLIFLALAVFKTNYKSFLMMLYSIFYILFVFAQVWAGGIIIQKFFVIILIVVYCCIILPETTKFKYYTVQFLLFTFLLLTNYIFNPVKIINTDISKKMTNTKDVSVFLEKNNIQNNEYLIIDEGCVVPDTFLIYGMNIKNYLIINKEDYNNNKEEYSKKIFDEIYADKHIKYIIINTDIDHLSDTGKFQRIMEIKEEEKGTLGLFNSIEFYNVYKITDN